MTKKVNKAGVNRNESRYLISRVMPTIRVIESVEVVDPKTKEVTVTQKELKGNLGTIRDLLIKSKSKFTVKVDKLKAQAQYDGKNLFIPPACAKKDLDVFVGEVSTFKLYQIAYLTGTIGLAEQKDGKSWPWLSLHNPKCKIPLRCFTGVDTNTKQYEEDLLFAYSVNAMNKEAVRVHLIKLGELEAPGPKRKAKRKGRKGKSQKVSKKHAQKIAKEEQIKKLQEEMAAAKAITERKIETTLGGPLKLNHATKAVSEIIAAKPEVEIDKDFEAAKAEKLAKIVIAKSKSIIEVKNFDLTKALSEAGIDVKVFNAVRKADKCSDIQVKIDLLSGISPEVLKSTRRINNLLIQSNKAAKLAEYQNYVSEASTKKGPVLSRKEFERIKAEEESRISKEEFDAEVKRRKDSEIERIERWNAKKGAGLIKSLPQGKPKTKDEDSYYRTPRRIKKTMEKGPKPTSIKKVPHGCNAIIRDEKFMEEKAIKLLKRMDKKTGKANNDKPKIRIRPTEHPNKLVCITDGTSVHRISAIEAKLITENVNSKFTYCSKLEWKNAVSLGYSSYSVPVIDVKTPYDLFEDKMSDLRNESTDKAVKRSAKNGHRRSKNSYGHRRSDYKQTVKDAFYKGRYIKSELADLSSKDKSKFDFKVKEDGKEITMRRTKVSGKVKYVVVETPKTEKKKGKGGQKAKTPSKKQELAEV